MKRMYQVLCILAIVMLLISCSKEKDNKTTPRADIEGLESIVLSITEIKDDYFLAGRPWPSPSKYKVFTTLNEELCEGDYVDVYYDEMIEISENNYEITPQLVELSDFKLQPGVAYKPVIYFYPTETKEVYVTLDYNGTLTHTYPTYSDGWSITAYPNGTLVDANGNEYPYLFWEGESNIEYDMSKGFCVSGNETEQFLRNKLSYMGLKQNELEDFIEFWVPFMEKNPYNKISFQYENYTEHAKLMVNPEPDSILRVYMVYQPLEEFVRVEEQELTKFERTGFTVIEWGGSIIE